MAKRPKTYFIISLIMFGSIGIFVKYLPFKSEMIACARGVMGSLFAAGFCVITRQKISISSVKKNLILLILSGTALGINWVFLFQAYKYINISTAIVCYYFAPVIVTVLSPVFLKEKLTAGKAACVLAALAGLVCVTGISTHMAENLVLGITYGLSAAVLYASIVIMNKKMVDIGGIERSVIQLGVSAITMLPYVLANNALPAEGAALDSILLLFFVGIVLTGVAYLMYFSIVDKIKAQTLAILSYIDPITAIILSSLILSEKMTLIQVFGTLLILGATLVNEVVIRDKSESLVV